MPDPRHPNVILISTDQHRADTLGIAGHPCVYTPGIDAMALSGHYFPSALSEAPSCVAARRTLFSGQIPFHHGMIGFNDMLPWEEQDTLCRCFQRGGYKTYSVGKRHIYPQDDPKGFDKILTHEEARFLSPGYKDDYLDWLKEQGWGDFGLFNAGVTNNAHTSRPCVFPEKYHVTTWTASKSIEVMEEHIAKHGHDQPFFLYTSFSKPHPPWDPPEFFYNRYANDPDIPKPVLGDPAKYATRDAEYRMRMRGPVPEAEFLPMSLKDVRRARAGYYGCIDHIDTQITRFFYHLWRMLRIRNTILVFVSDHGDMLGDHHRWAKCVGYEGSIRVPFILNFPATMNIPAGCRYPNVTVGLQDVMPTLLDACHLPIPKKVDGLSLMPLVRGETKKLDRDHLHGEHLQYGHFLANHREKFIWHYRTDTLEYYDLKKDPYERRNLYGKSNKRAQALHRQLKELLEKQGRANDFMENGEFSSEKARQFKFEPPPYAA